MPDDDTISVSSGVTVKGKPFVHYQWLGEVRKAQWSPEEALAHAHGIIQAAEASIHDAAVYCLLREKLNLPDAAASQFIADLRNYRRPKGT